MTAGVHETKIKMSSQNLTEIFCKKEKKSKIKIVLAVLI